MSRERHSHTDRPTNARFIARDRERTRPSREETSASLAAAASAETSPSSSSSSCFRSLEWWRSPQSSSCRKCCVSAYHSATGAINVSLSTRIYGTFQVRFGVSRVRTTRTCPVTFFFQNTLDRLGQTLVSPTLKRQRESSIAPGAASLRAGARTAGPRRRRSPRTAHSAPRAPPAERSQELPVGLVSFERTSAHTPSRFCCVFCHTPKLGEPVRIRARPRRSREGAAAAAAPTRTRVATAPGRDARPLGIPLGFGRG